jgi:hypothetical protein
MEPASILRIVSVLSPLVAGSAQVERFNLLRLPAFGTRPDLRALLAPRRQILRTNAVTVRHAAAVRAELANLRHPAPEARTRAGSMAETRSAALVRQRLRALPADAEIFSYLRQRPTEDEALRGKVGAGKRLLVNPVGA